MNVLLSISSFTLKSNRRNRKK